MISLLPTDTCYGLAWEFNEQDYHEIYRLKWRNFTNPLAWVVRNYDSLKKYIEITDEQIDFLKSYHRPWSILGKRMKSYVLPNFLDPETYQMISLRVAGVCIPADIRNNIQYPFFLTSANISGNPESKTLAEARGYFPWIDGIDHGVCDELPSDIFEFGENWGIKYLRKLILD